MILNFEITFGTEYGNRESTYCSPLMRVHARDWELFSRLYLDKAFPTHRLTEAVLRVDGKEQPCRVVRVDGDFTAAQRVIEDYQRVFTGAYVFTNR
ncbi:hypothetical protein [Synechococcus phage MA10]|uniref:Uncharacterized protein n=1 Tax=Synechococcus phage S-H34 TaxID=2718942 RepID=A0A6G8R6D5_9CAUD|nr:hypothetical protein PQC15_gp100 [Synechococcus phage S-H34]QIN96971.1 hypothetical protein [Synechococcus phage S-H34]